MKILFVSTDGMSTGLFLKKMEKYWKEHGEDHSIHAVNVYEYQDVYSDYDIIMTSPQISHKIKEIETITQLPVEGITSHDYALIDCADIMNIANKLYEQKYN